MYRAFLDGRADKDPCEGWYKGELGFFDFYIIPLAKKLKDCGVFGVSSDEYLTYALQNRKEWEAKGPQVVAELVQSVRYMNPDAPVTKPQRGLEPSRSLRAQDIVDAQQGQLERRMSNSQDSLEASIAALSNASNTSNAPLRKVNTNRYMKQGGN